MEDDKNLLIKIKQLEKHEIVKMKLLEGLIIKVEETEYNHFKLTVQLENDIFEGIYIKKQYGGRPQIGENVIFKSIFLEKKEREIYIYLKDYMIMQNENNKENNNEYNKKQIYDLSSKILIKILINIEPKKNYNSDVFMFKQKEIGKIILVPINENKEIYIYQDEESKFNNFLKENNIEKNQLISINNYIYENNSILFNNLTLFNISKCEYIDEYFQKQLINNNDLKTTSIFPYIKKVNQKQIFDCVFLKVIEINDNFFLGIDHIYNIYKVYSNNNNKINNEIDLYKLVLIKNFTLTDEDNIFYIIIVSENSFVYIYENSFKDSILNDLTVLYLNIIDFKKSLEDNLFNKICFENIYNNYSNCSFKINKKSEYFIINTKNSFFYNHYPIKIKLMNNSCIHSFKINIYFGILNKINCFINNKSEDKYSLDYLYFNFSFILPDRHEEAIGEITYNIKDSDTFNSKTRKRFVIINIPGNKFTEIYHIKKRNKKNKDSMKLENKINIEKDKIKEEKKISQVKEEKNKIKEEIKTDNNDKDIIIENIIIEKMHDSLQLCFLYKENQKYLLGIYNIEDIIFQKNDYLVVSNKYYVKPIVVPPLSKMLGNFFEGREWTTVQKSLF